MQTQLVIFDWDGTLFNSVGQIVLRESITQDKTDINIHKEPNGIYFVKVIDDNITVTFKKIVKQ